MVGKFMKNCVISSIICMAASAANAQMLDAAKIRPILSATKGQWVAVREWNGQDVVYFTHLLSWRCGLDKIEYGINSKSTDKVWNFIPCDETHSNPMALPADQQIFQGFNLKSIDTITVKITYDDGKVDSVTFDRAAVEIQ